MEKQGIEFPEAKSCDIYIASMGDAALERAMILARDLRECGYRAEYDVVGRGIKAQMKYANKIGAVYTMVLGDNEISEGAAKLKEMESGKEVEIKLDDKFIDSFDSIYVDKMLEGLESAADALMPQQEKGNV